MQGEYYFSMQLDTVMVQMLGVCTRRLYMTTVGDLGEHVQLPAVAIVD